MSLRFVIVIWLAVSATSWGGDAAPASATEFLSLDHVWPIHLKCSSTEWQAMQAAKKGGIAWLVGPKLPARPVPEPDRPKSVSPFGYEYPYGRAAVEIAGIEVEGIGLRYKGNSSFATARGMKRPFKLDFNRYHDNRAFLGLTMFNLSNNVMDPGCLREALAYWFFRAAGVPAPRTTFAQVSLSIDGEKEREYLGLYTIVECVDKRFLKERFGSSKGLLLKPEKAGWLPYLGDDWAKYREAYGAKEEATPAQAARVAEFAKLINKGDDAEFRTRIGEYLDIDAFLRLAAANSLLANLDSFFGLGHNYYLYLNPTTQKFAIIPWDLDHSFGSLGMLGSVEDMTQWSIRKPYYGKNMLAQRLLALPEHDARFRVILQELLAGPFRMLPTIDKARETIKQALAEEPRHPRPAGAPPRTPQGADLPTFVTKRTTSVIEQLAGRSVGFEAQGFSLFGRPNAGLGQPLADAMMRSADADRDGKLTLAELEAAGRAWFAAVDTATAGTLEAAAVVAAVEPLLPPPPGKELWPVRALVTAWFKQAEAGDQPLKLDAAQASARKLFTTWDRDKNERLDRDELVRGLNALK